MAYDAVGKIYIPLEEFYEFVSRYHPKFHGDIRYGKVLQTNSDIEIDYATSTEADPSQWVKPPDFLKNQR